MALSRSRSRSRSRSSSGDSLRANPDTVDDRLAAVVPVELLTLDGRVVCIRVDSDASIGQVVSKFKTAAWPSGNVRILLNMQRTIDQLRQVRFSSASGYGSKKEIEPTKAIDICGKVIELDHLATRKNKDGSHLQVANVASSGYVLGRSVHQFAPDIAALNDVEEMVTTCHGIVSLFGRCCFSAMC